jgi:hypothetical protein
MTGLQSRHKKSPPVPTNQTIVWLAWTFFLPTVSRKIDHGKSSMTSQRKAYFYFALLARDKQDKLLRYTCFTNVVFKYFFSKLLLV